MNENLNQETGNVLNQKLTKIIIAQLLLINLIALVGCPSKPKKTSNDDNTPKDAYDLTFDVSCEDIMQCSFPKAASNFHGNVDFTNGVWVGTVVADLSESDLSKIIEEMNLALAPDILDIWPEAFDCKTNKFWDVSHEINSDTYYFEYPDELTRIVLKYENGKMYFKRETKYSTMIGEDGTVLYTKITK